MFDERSVANFTVELLIWLWAPAGLFVYRMDDVEELSNEILSQILL